MNNSNQQAQAAQQQGNSSSTPPANGVPRIGLIIKPSPITDLQSYTSRLLPPNQANNNNSNNNSNTNNHNNSNNDSHPRGSNTSVIGSPRNGPIATIPTREIVGRIHVSPSKSINNINNINHVSINNQPIININRSSTQPNPSTIVTAPIRPQSQQPQQQQQQQQQQPQTQPQQPGLRAPPFFKMKSRPKKNERISLSSRDDDDDDDDSETASDDTKGDASKKSEKEDVKKDSETVVTQEAKTPVLQNKAPSLESIGKQQQGANSQPQYHTPPVKRTLLSTPFSWETYLRIMPAPVAPREAFMQTPLPVENKFKPGMKLEARDPRNIRNWCLASVIGIEGLRLRLRLDGSDAMNDFFELIDSENIRPVNSKPHELLLPPMAFVGSNYMRYVEKVLSKPETVVAPEECFVKTPKRPSVNLFQEGMKLEAVDKKNPHLVCPASVGHVDKNTIRVIFDGWRGSFDYSCEYYSRDIFPINWCRDTNHFITSPNGWEGILMSDGQQHRHQQQHHQQQQQNRFASQGSSLLKHATPAPMVSKKLPITHQSTSPSTSNTSVRKPKGRPPKSSKLKEMNLSTPKKVPKASPTKSRSSPSLDEFLKDLEQDDLQDVANKYQCQRTVPYDEWRRIQREELMPQKIDSDANDSKSSTVLMSDSASLASAISDTQETTQTREIECGNNSKKVKIETRAEPSVLSRRIELISSKPNNLISWTVSDVIDLIKTDETLCKYSNVFENHEIDGKAFKLLTTDVMINHMGLKIGPVLKINDLIEQVRRLK